MKLVAFAMAVLAAVVIFGCADNPMPPPQEQSGQTQETLTDSPRGNFLLPGFYTFSGTDDYNEGFLNLIRINPFNGRATTVWKLGVSNTATELVSPFGLTFDVDGSIYAFVSWLDFTPGHQYSRLARVDSRTGAVAYIGAPIPLHFAAPEIDANGTLYVTGFTVGPPEGGDPLIFGDDVLYRVNKVTGAPTAIGHTGRTDWMDLASDAQGRLWATTDNKLYQLNKQTGAATFITNITGVPQTPLPGITGIPPEDWQYMEVMTIAFDDLGILWATAMKGFSLGFGNGIVLRINPHTGRATYVGVTNKPYNHGGDIKPLKVRLCHLLGNGSFSSLVVSMDALAAHLAHGDIVPGAAGNSCNCP